MIAKITELKFTERGKIMLVEMDEPLQPAYKNIDTDDKAAQFVKDVQDYHKKHLEWQNLKLGEIDFHYL